MYEDIAKLKTIEGCEQYALNNEARSPELARAARRRAVELRAAEHGATRPIERELLEAVYAYERVLSRKRGKKTRASRTWQMIDRHGIIKAAEAVVSRKVDSAGYSSLVAMDMQDMAFEAVVLRHPESFSAEAVAQSEERMHQWTPGAPSGL